MHSDCEFCPKGVRQKPTKWKMKRRLFDLSATLHVSMFSPAPSTWGHAQENFRCNIYTVEVAVYTFGIVSIRVYSCGSSLCSQQWVGQTWVGVPPVWRKKKEKCMQVSRSRVYNVKWQSESGSVTGRNSRAAWLLLASFWCSLEVCRGCFWKLTENLLDHYNAICRHNLYFLNFCIQLHL